MATKRYACDVHILGKGPLKGVELWLSSASQAEAKKAAEAMFPGQRVTGVYNIKEKK
jgi:hypothetical protein